ncbi:Bactoprenol-linked glucose translocase homolog from prophage CPS-53 [Serratia odorifera]|uniref:Bactoprenol-linked glucose translocase homolog from prophage CPS-53 n=1 Tax=Serratia odorifera TaxID=618 RepID=A0A447L2T9_SEROD|nr:Bactoprenol-linked glucose translocase homolog from prophage CPS-53 [Serratia odorifera]
MNTCAHWAVFALMLFSGFSQSVSNVVALSIAVTVSFFANAKWTFKAQATTNRYTVYVLFMGGMAFSVGWAADTLHAPTNCNSRYFFSVQPDLWLHLF